MFLGTHRGAEVCVMSQPAHWRKASRNGFVGLFVFMKPLLVFIFLLLVSSGLAAGEFSIPTPPPVSDDVLLAAIAEVETGNNSATIGRSGERTRLQIAPETWVRFSRLPHSAAAANREETDRVARAYLASIRTRLKSRGLPLTPFFIAAAWNVGPGWKTLPSCTVAYAERVANLVQTYRAEQAEVVQRASVKAVPMIAVLDLPESDAMAVAVPSVRPIFRPINLN